jgi:hypothetical protein
LNRAQEGVTMPEQILATRRRFMEYRETILMLALPLLVAIGGATCECQGSGEQSANAPLMIDAGSDPCPHPLMPLIEGAHWTYEVTSAPTQSPSITELRVIEVTAKGRSRTAKLRKTAGVRQTVVEAFCNAEGVSFLPMFVELGPPLPTTMNYVPTVTNRTGALLLPPSQLRPGATWSHIVEAHTDQPGGKALTMDSQWQVEATNMGEQKVVVPAGTYQARQFKLVVTGHHRPPAEKEVVFTEQIADPPPMTFTYSLVEGVGVVQIEAEPREDRLGLRPRWVLSKVSLDR